MMDQTDEGLTILDWVMQELMTYLVVAAIIATIWGVWYTLSTRKERWTRQERNESFLRHPSNQRY